MNLAEVFPNELIQSHAFEYQPTPTIVLSEHATVIFANRACRTLFSKYKKLLGTSIRSLPILWKDGTHESFYTLLTQGSSTKQSNLDQSDDNLSSSALKLQVEIGNRAAGSRSSACLLVTNMMADGQCLRLLSFENVTSAPEVHYESPSLDDIRVSFADPDEKRAVRDDARSGTLGSTTTSQDHLTTRYAKFRDAFYFSNRERAGFILSADETFALPNYNGDKDVAPVEIDDITLFLENWNLWDAQFTRKLPHAEYPSIWLNEHRTRFQSKRCGIKEDGKNMVVEVSGDPLYDPESNEYIGGVVWVRTLGDLDTVMADDLAASLADVRMICDRLPHILWTADPEGKADYFSQSWYDFTGLSEEESLGFEFLKAIDSVDMQKFWTSFAKAAENNTECYAEARYRRHDGQYMWFSVRAKPLYDTSGKLLKWYGSSTDIHNLVMERVQAERRKQQLMEMLSLADVGLFEVDSNWQLMMIDGRMLWLEDCGIANLSTQLDQSRCAGAMTLKKHLEAVMTARQETAVFEEKISSRWYKFRLVADVDNRGDLQMPRKVLGCSVDITEQRERAALESENARLSSAALLETEKSRLKTAFLAHMSHEIRTPIAGIIGTAEMLAESSLGNEQQDGIKDIQISANNLLTIVNDILDLSKIEAGRLSLERIAFDIHDLLLQVKKHFNHIARDKLSDVICKQDLSTQLEIVGDPGRVKQILMNLVSNAVKFTSEGFIEISIATTGTDIRIEVRDTGIGIDEQTLSTLFKPFVQGDTSTARRHGGTGLGLTISRNLAEMMRGSLVLRSMPGKGTTAILTLPGGFITATAPQTGPEIEKPEHKAIETTANNSRPGPSSEMNPIILIVEDNAINQKVALNLVRKLGYCTEAVWNGQEALEYLEQRETPSLILMDCQMPILDGYAATRELRTNTLYHKARAVPVVALTASAIQGDKEKCFAAGMNDYLSKPVSKTVLQKMLEKWLSPLKKP